MSRIDYTAAMARTRFFAETVGETPPDTIIDDDGGASDAFMAFCDRTGMSMDWAILNDMRPLIRREYRQHRDGNSSP